MDDWTTLLHTRLASTQAAGRGAGVCYGWAYTARGIITMAMYSTRSRSEGRVARGIEAQTSKLPSDAFLWAAFGSIMGSFVLQAMGKKDESNFVGHWAPTLLILGMYNKMVKLLGSD
jgi:hypothetical protein